MAMWPYGRTMVIFLYSHMYLDLYYRGILMYSGFVPPEEFPSGGRGELMAKEPDTKSGLWQRMLPMEDLPGKLS